MYKLIPFAGLSNNEGVGVEVRGHRGVNNKKENIPHA
jgi:hypothetical protein